MQNSYYKNINGMYNKNAKEHITSLAPKKKFMSFFIVII